MTNDITNLNYLTRLQAADFGQDLNERRALAESDQKHSLSISTESKLDNFII